MIEAFSSFETELRFFAKRRLSLLHLGTARTIVATTDHNLLNLIVLARGQESDPLLTAKIDMDKMEVLSWDQDDTLDNPVAKSRLMAEFGDCIKHKAYEHAGECVLAQLNLYTEYSSVLLKVGTFGGLRLYTEKNGSRWLEYADNQGGYGRCRLAVDDKNRAVDGDLFIPLIQLADARIELADGKDWFHENLFKMVMRHLRSMNVLRPGRAIQSANIRLQVEEFHWALVLLGPKEDLVLAMGLNAGEAVVYPVGGQASGSTIARLFELTGPVASTPDYDKYLPLETDGLWLSLNDPSYVWLHTLLGTATARGCEEIVWEGQPGHKLDTMTGSVQFSKVFGTATKEAFVGKLKALAEKKINVLWDKTTVIKEETMQKDTPPTLPSFKEVAKNDAKEAAIRTAANQLTKLVRDPLAAAIARHLGEDDESTRKKVSDFLRTETGTALLAGLLSIAMLTVPNGVPNRDAIEAMARELRVKSMAGLADETLDLLMGPLRAVMAFYIQDMANAPAPTAEAPAQLPQAQPTGPDLYASLDNAQLEESLKKVASK